MDIGQTIKRVTLADISDTSERVSMMMARIREGMLAPDVLKVAPSVTLGDLASACSMDRAKLLYRIKREEKVLPQGITRGGRREFSMEDAQTLVREFRPDALRPNRASAVTITIANFKGGVAKTTSAVTLAQGLSLRGHKTLLIDLDPQGSATTLFGFLPDIDVEAEHTCMSLFAGDTETIDPAIRKTYWPGIDLVCAAPLLFGSEFVLPARQSKDPGFEFWRVLDRGLDIARETYDVIIIDTPPALSYVTINALMAADGVIMPLPPSALDFASSSQFWNLFSDLCEQLIRNRGQDKAFEFVDILMSRVEASDTASNVVRSWIIEAYGDKVLQVEIPKTSITASSAAEFGTVYDIDRTIIDSRTYQRAKTAYDRFCELVEIQVRAVWTNQIAALKE